MSKFRSSFDLGNEKFFTPEGSQEFPVFEFDENDQLVEVGKTNVFEKIQSYKDECLLENVIKRCVSTGEVLIPSKAQFMDTTQFPKDLLEVQEHKNRSEDFVNSLSEFDRSALFEKGFDQWLSDKIADQQKSADVKPKEVNGNE